MPRIEILECNKLIAEFMDGRLYEVDNQMCWILPDVFSAKTYTKPSDLKYHYSWDWLMPVWFKCKEIGLWMMANGYDTLWLEKSKEIENCILNENNCDKAALKILLLIKWYNANKKP